MLAKLLQRILLALTVAGAGLAILWHGASGDIVLGALLLPWLAAVTATGYTMLRSRAPLEASAAFYRAWWGETIATFRTFVLRQPWANAAPRLLAAATTDAHVPVLLVHGYLCNHRVWDDMVPELRDAGHDVLAIDLEPLFVSIDQYVHAIEAGVQQLLQHSGQSRVVLVGHSMGGLAIRAWMRQFGDARVARVLTLGTPHAGTHLANANNTTTNGRQMAWNSIWLRGLAESESPARRALMRIALTAQDNIVFPQREQQLPAVSTTVFEGLGHLQLCSAPEVMDWILRELLLLRDNSGPAPTTHATDQRGH